MAKTILPNGVVQPSIGSNEWGEDVNNNFKLLDDLIGEKQQSKVAYTELNNTFNGINTFNQPIIGSLQGIAEIAIKDAQGRVIDETYALESNVVHIKGSDDIIDSKKFISLYTQSSGPSLWMKNTSFTMGTTPTTNRYSGLWVQDSNDTDIAYIVHQANKNNSQNLKFSVSNTDGSNTCQNALTFQARSDGTFNFYSDNPANLGTSSNKWTTINGINPGALSFPGKYSSSMVVDTTNFATDGTTNVFTPQLDGWLTVRARKTGFTSIAIRDVTTAIGNCISTNDLAVTSDFLETSLPVRAGDTVNINVNITSRNWYVILVPCQGNV